MRVVRSSASAMTTDAPSARKPSDLPADRVMAITSWPAATSPWTSGMPIVPEPPATNTFMMSSPDAPARYVPYPMDDGVEQNVTAEPSRFYGMLPDRLLSLIHISEPTRLLS